MHCHNAIQYVATLDETNLIFPNHLVQYWALKVGKHFGNNLNCIVKKQDRSKFPTISTPFFLNHHNICIIQSIQSSYSIIHLCYCVHAILFDQIAISFEKDDRKLSTHDALYIGNLCITPLISFSNIFTF